MRVALVIHYPIHYYAPQYRALAADPDIDLEVLFMGGAASSTGYDADVGQRVEWGVPLLEGYAYEIFRNVSPWRDGRGFWKHINPGLIRRLVTGGYDAVYVHACNYLTNVVAIVVARALGKRVIFRADAYNLGDRSSTRRLARRLAYRSLFRLVDVFLYIGRHNRAFYEAFGATPRQLVYAPYVVDNPRFDAACQSLRPRRDELRRDFGLSDGAKVVLFAAKFMDKKRPLLMIDAFVEAQLGEPWVLLMVGQGALYEAARERAAATDPQRIVLTGFLDQSDIAKAYAVADMFVLPSAYAETWGLVVNEAMNFGLPVVASDHVGCAPDLVADTCGLVVPRDDRAALAQALRRLAQDDELRAHFGAAARAKIADWSIPAYVRGVRQALGLDPAPPSVEGG